MKSLKMTFVVLNFAALSIGCTGAFESSLGSFSSGGTGLSSGVVNQAPKVACTVTNLSSGMTQDIGTNGSLDTFFAVRPKAGETLQFNCDNTQDESPLSDLNFSIDINFNPDTPNFLPLVGSAFQIPLTAAGNFPMAIKVTDGDNLTRIKTFSMIVTCASEVVPVISANAVTVTPTSKLNFFNFSVSSSEISGGNTFEYSWDFNGDGVFDPVDLNSVSAWTRSSSLSNIFTVFASTAIKKRALSLKVRNDCQFETARQVDVVFEMNNIPRTPTALATEKPFYYIQADISGTPTSNQRVNGDFLATWYPGDAPKRVLCDYKFSRLGVPAIFNIRGQNWYRGAATLDKASEFLHGMTMLITGIPDTGTMGEQSLGFGNGVRVGSATFSASAADDGIVQENFTRIDSACDVTVRVKRAAAIVPCTASETTQADFTDAAVIITGEFDCPSLTNVVNGQSVAAHNGKFFCEVAPSNQCVGAGAPCTTGICSGGGGLPPPKQ